MDQIKEAFQKIKREMNLLNKERDTLKLNVAELKDEFDLIKNYLEQINYKLDLLGQNEEKFNNSNKTNNLENNYIKTDNTTDNLAFRPLNPQNQGISIGNEGVPADRQTHRQTHRQTPFKGEMQENSIDNAIEILESLDNIKREIRLKFKRLTEKELLVFSTIYQLDEEQGFADHKVLSERLNLTQSSIRDYIGRLIKKGIPVEKTKINNKSVRLSISNNLKKIATLSTILQLRDL